jgi:misacylated tRNA(Ala) deacylase
MRRAACLARPGFIGIHGGVSGMSGERPEADWEKRGPQMHTAETSQIAPTELLYHKDSYVKAFDARVLAVEGAALALDRTAFFPGGGGQMADCGALVWGGRRLSVVGLRKDGDAVWHAVEAAEGPLPGVSETVRGELDWGLRYRMMRTHTALHTLCGVIFRDFGAQVTGGQMYPDRARMDFAMEAFSPDLTHRIEETVNATLAAAHPIKVYSLPRAEAFEIPDLIRTKINLLPPAIQTIRIVEIEGVDLQADGGTHVANTREVGQIRVMKTENKGRINKRMEIALVDEE